MGVFGFPLSNPAKAPPVADSVGGSLLIKRVPAKSEIIEELGADLILTEYRVTSTEAASGKVDFQKADDDSIPAFLFAGQCLNVVHLGIELRETEIIQVFNRSDFDVWFILDGVRIP
ncbi:MAG: hypothetical protein ACFCBU_01365 [Cyanophyceae cyanobacterium]